MESAFTNEIAANIHLHCAKVYGTPATYTQDSVKFRENIENCFQNVLYQSTHVINGIHEFYKVREKM